MFERASLACAHYGGMIPVNFFLGFYVHLVTTRWWHQFVAVPSPQEALGTVTAHMLELAKAVNTQCRQPRLESFSEM